MVAHLYQQLLAKKREKEIVYNEMQKINEFSRLEAEWRTKASECLLKACRPTLRAF